MRNLLVTMAYDGSHYHGWQIQENALAVQEVFQKALQKIIGPGIDIKGCSRTDSGRTRPPVLRQHQNGARHCL